MRALPQARLPRSGRGAPSPRARLLQLTLNWLAFGLCYPLANLLAERLPAVRSLALGADASIPFVPWTIIPYATSGLIFTLVFLVAPTREALRTVSRRLLAATVTGTLVFAILPARFSFVRPPMTAPWHALYAWLDLVDRPFNQCPSLHVAYCVIFWAALRPLCRGAARSALAAWLLLVAASTLFTWQHRVADVAGGCALGWAAVALIRPGATSRHTVSFAYAIAAGVVLLVGVGAWHSPIAAYAAASLVLVAVAYARRQVGFLLKQGGTHPWTAWLLYWPYLMGYRLTWMLVLLRERRRPPLECCAPGLWIGRRLTTGEAHQLPPDCQVIDLTGELPETTPLRRRYAYLPMLDLQAPTPSQLRRVLDEIALHRRANTPVYVHCAMGYSRSRWIARLYLRKQRRCPSPSIS